MEWISVKKQLPELDKDVLVWTTEKLSKYPGASNTMVAKLYKHPIDDKLNWTTPWLEVTHWQKLPEPPKDE